MEKGAVVLVTGGSSGIGRGAPCSLPERLPESRSLSGKRGGPRTPWRLRGGGVEAFAIRGACRTDHRSAAGMAEAVDRRAGAGSTGWSTNAAPTRFHDPFRPGGADGGGFRLVLRVNVPRGSDDRAAAPAGEARGPRRVVPTVLLRPPRSRGQPRSRYRASRRGEYAHPLPRPGSWRRRSGSTARATHRLALARRSGWDERYAEGAVRLRRLGAAERLRSSPRTWPTPSSGW